MSYKHLDQIRDLYESVNDIENRDNELVNEIITVISTSMFVEGYTNVAIKNYFDCADPVEIFEKYEEYSKDFLFVDEKTLNESVEHDLVLDEESIKELNLIIEGIGGFIKGLKKVASPYLSGMKTAARKGLKSDNPVAKKIYLDNNPVMKKIYGVKDGIKNKIKNVSTKSKSTILGPDGKPYVKTTSPKNTSAKETVSKITKTVKDKSKEVFDKSKKVLGSKEAKKTINNILKPTTKRGGALRFAAAGSAGALLTKIGSGNKENKKPENKKPETKSTQKNYKEGEKPKYDLSGVKGSDTKEKKTSDIGSQIYNNAVKISQSQAKPSTASGKETPKPRAIGKGKGEINPNSARGRMIAKNQERFGKDRIKKLRDKNAAFQAARKKGTGYSMDDFVKDFPDSNTAKDRAKRKKIPSVMDYESYDPQMTSVEENRLPPSQRAGSSKSRLIQRLRDKKANPNANAAASATIRNSGALVNDHYTPYDLVLEYLLSTEQADTIEEANYIMTEMDAQTIQGIVEDFEKQFQ